VKNIPGTQNLHHDVTFLLIGIFYFLAPFSSV